MTTHDDESAQRALRRPEDIVGRQDLSRDDKIALLHRLEYDARELEVAEEEGMGVGEPGYLQSIIHALHALGVTPDVERSAPTKQRGESGEG